MKMLLLLLALLVSSCDMYTHFPSEPPAGQRDGLGSNPISWRTNRVWLDADDFYLSVDGLEYDARSATVSVHSDPGDPHYCTLEMQWNENEHPMWLFFYFRSDGAEWSAFEIRILKGRNYDWIYFADGPYFRSPLGSEYRGDFQMSSTFEDHPQQDPATGVLHFKNLRLRAFL